MASRLRISRCLSLCFACVCIISFIFKDTYIALAKHGHLRVFAQKDGKLVNANQIIPKVIDDIIKEPTKNVSEDNKITVKPNTKFIDPHPRRRVHHVDCNALFAGNKEEKKNAKLYVSNHPKITSVMNDDESYRLAIHCDALKARGYIMDSMTKEEQDFPIAFSLLMHRNAEQTENLLRLIYRPQNTYCIHVDMKSPASVHLAMQAIADCFDNVFIASKLEFLVYASWSRLQAEFNCMEDALEKGRNWKYYINMVSEVFPLKTNAELVKILKIFNGTNDIELLRPGKIERYKTYYRSVIKRKKDGTYITYMNNTGIAKPAPPHGLTIVKGSAYSVFSREFVEFMLSPDPVVQDFLSWSKDTYSPDEHVFATLHSLKYNPQLNAPGGYNGKVYICHYF